VRPATDCPVNRRFAKTLADCRLYTFVDADHLDGRTPVGVAEMLCANGADLVQLRAKNWTPERITETALELISVTSAHGVRLVINDHPLIAAETNAAACHLGQEDFFDSGGTAVANLRGAAGTLEIGLSSHAPDQALRAVRAGADYVAIGPVYPTPTKPGRPPVTLDYVRWAAENLTTPWFAIGGVNLSTIDDILAAGARRICVVSAILRAPDPAAACRRFREKMDQAATFPPKAEAADAPRRP
jgi:thiamine-phosphate pyrophosphorylase